MFLEKGRNAYISRKKAIILYVLGRFIYLAALFIQSNRFLFIPNHNFLLLHASITKCVFSDGNSKRGTEQSRIPEKNLEKDTQLLFFPKVFIHNQ